MPKIFCNVLNSDGDGVGDLVKKVIGSERKSSEGGLGLLSVTSM